MKEFLNCMAAAAIVVLIFSAPFAGFYVVQWFGWNQWWGVGLGFWFSLTLWMYADKLSESRKK
jgi:hypothetical protein